MSAFAAIRRTGAPIPRQAGTHMPHHRQPNVRHLGLARPRQPLRSPTLRLPPAFLRRARQFRLGRVPLFVPAGARHVHAAAVASKHREARHQPHVGKQLFHPSPKDRFQPFDQRIGPLPQQFHECLIAFRRLRLPGKPKHDNLTGDGEPVAEGFFVRPRPQNRRVHQRLRRPSAVLPQSDDVQRHTAEQPNESQQ